MILALLLTSILVATFSIQSVFKKQFCSSSPGFFFLVSCWLVLTIFSYIFTICVLYRAGFGTFMIVSTGLTAILALAVRRHILFNLASIREIKRHQNHWYSIFLWLAIMIFSLCFFHYSRRWGWSGWDAWAIWNLHAKFMASGNDFFNIYAAPAFTARDYPLMLPSLNAMLWNATGTVSPMIPMTVSYFTTLSVVLLLYFSFKSLSSRIAGAAAMTIMLTNLWFIELGAWQYADVMVSLYLFLAIALLQHWVENDKNPWVAIALGFFAASGGWVKNEGLLLFAIISLVFVLSNRFSLRHTGAFACGTALPLAIILVYKLCFTPQNDFISQLNVQNITANLLDISRYIHVLKYFTINIVLPYYPHIIILLIASIALGTRKLTVNTLVIGTIIMLYTTVYVITQSGLDWNLDTSGDRLFNQVYPSVLFVLVNSFRNSRRFNNALAFVTKSRFINTNG